jgi:hypothetical protein
MTTSIVTAADPLALYPLHKLGWKAFQDLCAAVAEECLQRPVQTFLPTNDAGSDGAFVGTWDSFSCCSGLFTSTNRMVDRVTFGKLARSS